MSTTVSKLTSIFALMAMVAVASVSVARADLVGHASLDSIGTLTIPTPAANTNDAHLVPGLLGNAIMLDGDNDYAEVNSQNPLIGTGARTVTVWVNQTIDATGQNSAVAIGPTDLNGTKWDIRVDNGNDGIEVGIGNGSTVDTASGFTDGEWHLIITSVEANKLAADIDTYLDLTLRDNASTSTPAIDTQAGPWRIGAPSNNDPPTGRFWNGLIDDSAIWDEVLSAGERKGLFDLALSTLAYDAGRFDSLKSLHDDSTGSDVVGGINWDYVTGLGSTEGLIDDGGGAFTLVLDGAAGTGVVTTGQVVQGPGDFDADGDVDGADFLKWQRGEVSSPPSAADLAEWQTNYGPGASSAATSSVPEPSTLSMLALMLGSTLVGLRNRRAALAPSLLQ